MAVLASRSPAPYVTHATDKQLGLADAWSRYLPPGTDPARSGNLGNSGNPAGQPVTDESPVTDPSVTATPSTPHSDRPPTPPGYRSIGNHPPIGNRLTSQVTEVTEVTDTHEDRGYDPVLFGLPREIDPDPTLIDEIAVDMASRGERVPLTAAERAEVLRRLTAKRESAAGSPTGSGESMPGRGPGAPVLDGAPSGERWKNWSP